MNNSLKIWKYIRKRLASNTELTASIPTNRIVPLMVDSGVNLPYIVFEREAVEPNYTKDIFTDDTVYFRIAVVATEYEDAIDLITLVRQSLELYRETNEDVKILPIKIKAAGEDFLSNAWIQWIQFYCTVL